MKDISAGRRIFSLVRKFGCQYGIGGLILVLSVWFYLDGGRWNILEHPRLVMFVASIAAAVLVFLDTKRRQ